MSDASPVFTAPLIRFAPDIELASGGDGRTIRGIIVPWDRAAQVQDVEEDGPYFEAFAPGAFDEWIASVGVERVKFLGHHKRDQNPLGRATLLRNDAAGQYGEFYVSKTAAGDDILELVRDGVLDAFSIGFTPGTHRKLGEVTYRTAASLNETSIVTFPAYADARVAGVRNAPDLSVLLAEQGAGESPVSGGSGEPTAEPRGWNRFQTAAAVALSNITKES